MIRKDKKVMKDGTVKTQIRVTQGYRPYPDAPPKQRTIMSFGYLEDQEDLDAFWARVHACNDGLKKNRDRRMEIPLSEKMYTEHNRLWNYGYKFPESVYRLLGMGEFMEAYQSQSGFHGTHSLNELFCCLVMDRILSPASGWDPARRQIHYYAAADEFEVSEVERALERFGACFRDLQREVRKHTEVLTGQTPECSYYFLTNCPAGSDIPGPDPSQTGSETQHAAHEIQLGLLVDGSGIPVSLDLFPEDPSHPDRSEKILEGLRRETHCSRIVVAADSMEPCARTTDLLHSLGVGCVFFQPLSRTQGTQYHDALFSEDGWQETPDHAYRWKVLEETCPCQDIRPGQQGEGAVKQQARIPQKRKVLLCWSKARAGRDARDRADKLWKTAGCPDAAEGGEPRRSAAEVLAAAAEDARLDGYCALVTSEPDCDPKHLRGLWHGLERVERAFQMTGWASAANPVQSHSESLLLAHLLICYAALTIQRVIQHFMGARRISAERIANALRAANCLLERGGYVRLLDVGSKPADAKQEHRKKERAAPVSGLSAQEQTARDYQAIQDTFGTHFYYAYAKQEDLNRFLGSIDLTGRP